ncbi:hypothetical protein SB30_120295 [Klebsiella quasipneumoniae subsp. similipneumoniae]|nr:hypothetical protein SB30_120295 [Klebsiella quasipneumoniae subsp. similipneumoniae]
MLCVLVLPHELEKYNRQDPLLYFAVFAQLLLSELTGLLCQIYPNFPARYCTRVTGYYGWELASYGCWCNYRIR